MKSLIATISCLLALSTASFGAGPQDSSVNLDGQHTGVGGTAIGGTVPPPTSNFFKGKTTEAAVHAALPHAAVAAAFAVDQAAEEILAGILLKAEKDSHK